MHTYYIHICITRTEKKRRAGVEKIKKMRLIWFRHVEQMEKERLPIAALHGLVEGKRSIGWQRNIWMDNVREDLKEKNINLTRIGEATRNREVWRKSAESLIVSMLMEERRRRYILGWERFLVVTLKGHYINSIDR